MTRILSIDIGVENLAWVLIDAQTRDILGWHVGPVHDAAEYVPMNNVDYVLRYIDRHRAHFDRADIVLIERQMRVNMRVIEALFHALCYQRATVLSARTVKARYGLCMRNYRLNKKAVAEYVRAHLPDNWRAWYEAQKKRDDLADALLQAWYYIDTHPATFSQQCNQTASA